MIAAVLALIFLAVYHVYITTGMLQDVSGNWRLVCFMQNLQSKQNEKGENNRSGRILLWQYFSCFRFLVLDFPLLSLLLFYVAVAF